jgi:hypothetical protein
LNLPESVGATYIALRGRFSDQWRYLAGVYNQIKAAECRRDIEKEALREWKAGFVEDAVEVHLARKRIYAQVIVNWLREPAVESLVLEYMGRTDFVKLKVALRRIVRRHT